MEKAIYFENKRIETIDINGEPYIASKELAKILEYKNDSTIRMIYIRHKQDFGAEYQFDAPLTTLEYKPNSNGKGGAKIRIFSLRGAMLIAMLSKTEVGVRFRKFILDILEGKQSLPTAPQSLIKASGEVNLLEGTSKVITSITRDEINNAVIRHNWDISNNEERIKMIENLFKAGYIFKK